MKKSIFVLLLVLPLLCQSTKASTSGLTFTEDYYGFVTISWAPCPGERVSHYEIIVSGDIMEDIYTNECQVQLHYALPKGKCIGVTLIASLSSGQSVNYLSGSYTYGNVAAGPCPKKIGEASATVQPVKTTSGQDDLMITIEHFLIDTGTNHKAFRVFIYAGDSPKGSTISTSYCDANGHVSLWIGNHTGKIYIKLEAADCPQGTGISGGHYLGGTIDLSYSKNQSVSLAEVNQ